MVVEVGMPGPWTLNQLRHTAHYWLTQHPGEVRIVLLIDINHAQRTMEMEKVGNDPSATSPFSIAYEARRVPVTKTVT